MPVSLCSTPADAPTPTPAGIAVSIPSPAWAHTCQQAHPGGCLRQVSRGKFSLRQSYPEWASAICEGSADVRLEMAKQPRDTIPALVLEVIAQVYKLSGHRTQPWYVDRSTLDLVDATDSVDSAIYYAELSGWLVGAGEPPQSVAITRDGVRLLEECGLI